MTEVKHHPEAGVPAASALAELTHGYLNLRKSYAEAATRATTETELRQWHDRTSRMRRYWAALAKEDLADVLDAIAAVHAEQQATDIFIAAQIATAHQCWR